jgi:hypothetical protein
MLNLFELLRRVTSKGLIARIVVSILVLGTTAVIIYFTIRQIITADNLVPGTDGSSRTSTANPTTTLILRVVYLVLTGSVGAIAALVSHRGLETGNGLLPHVKNPRLLVRGLAAIVIVIFCTSGVM